MIKIVTVSEMKEIEAEADKLGTSYAQMMNTAGRAVAERAKTILAEYFTDGEHPRVVVLVGPGNNGGDGLVAGSVIAVETSASVTFFLSRQRNDDDPNFASVRAANLLVADSETDSQQGYRVLRTMISNADLIIDALLGTGINIPLKGDMEKILKQVHQALTDRKADHESHRARTLISPSQPTPRTARQPFVLAVDIPTGLDADSGEIDKNALIADETVTFEAAKIGQLTPQGADITGRLFVAPLGLPEKLSSRDEVKLTLVTADVVRRLLPVRLANSNKGTFGKVLIVAGSVNYTGAPALAAQAAYRVGAGLGTVAAPESVVSILATHMLESTWLLLPDTDGVINEDAAKVVRQSISGYTALLIGPGMGQDDATKRFISALLLTVTTPQSARRIGFSQSDSNDRQSEAKTSLPPLVIDADGLNLLAKHDNWWTHLPARTILTPHPGEMARLASIQAEADKKPTEIVQSNRFDLALKSAAKWNCIVVLKGAYTVIADPDGRLAVLPFANAALARAGTGDVLAGAIAGCLAQGLDPFDAAVAAGYLHGCAGELAADLVGTKASVLASDVVGLLADAISSVENSD